MNLNTDKVKKELEDLLNNLDEVNVSNKIKVDFITDLFVKILNELNRERS